MNLNQVDERIEELLRPIEKGLNGDLGTSDISIRHVANIIATAQMLATLRLSLVNESIIKPISKNH